MTDLPVLAERLQAGDAGAFDAFVAAVRPKIFQYSYLNCGQREDAEEITQETLLSVFQKLHQLRDPAQVRPWIFRIAKNACTARRRKKGPEPAAEIALDDVRPAIRESGGERRLEIADWSHLPDDEAYRGEISALLRATILELSAPYRSVLLLRDIEELSVAETSAILDVTEDVVKTRLHRARLALRQRIDQHLRSKEAHR